MGLPYRLFIRPMLKFQDSEKAHHRSLFYLKKLSSFSVSRFALSTLYQNKQDLPVEVFGHTFKHPFGLAAGMDKKAEGLLGWQAMKLRFIIQLRLIFDMSQVHWKSRIYPTKNSCFLWLR